MLLNSADYIAFNLNSSNPDAREFPSRSVMALIMVQNLRFSSHKSSVVDDMPVYYTPTTTKGFIYKGRNFSPLYKIDSQITGMKNIMLTCKSNDASSSLVI